MIFALALLGCPREPLELPPPVAPERVEAEMCPSPWKIDHHDSLLSEARSRGPHWSDFPTAFAAETIGEGYVPVAVTGSFQVAQGPIFLFKPDMSAAVVDARWSGALTAVDATSIAAGATMSVGRLTPEGLAGMPPARWAELFVRAGVVRTYAHIGAEVCLTEQTLPDGTWKGVLRGEHVYFTNSENHAPVAVDILVAADGTVTVVGR